LIAFLTSKNGSIKNSEYRKMKFCELFRVSPFEYDNLPTKLVDSWLLMKNLENKLDEQRIKNSNISRR